MAITCAFMWRVASVGIIPYLAWLTLYGITFQVRDMYRWTTLIRGRNCEESRTVALINIFVKPWNNLVLVCNKGKRVVIELLRIVLKAISHIFNLNMDK